MCLYTDTFLIVFIIEDYSFKTLKRQAEALKLSETGIEQYVIMQQALAREEIAREREVNAARIKTEQEKVKLQHELEMAKLKHSPVNVPADIARPSLPTYRDGEDMAALSS